MPYDLQHYEQQQLQEDSFLHMFAAAKCKVGNGFVMPSCGRYICLFMWPARDMTQRSN